MECVLYRGRDVFKWLLPVNIMHVLAHRDGRCVRFVSATCLDARDNKLGSAVSALVAAVLVNIDGALLLCTQLLVKQQMLAKV